MKTGKASESLQQKFDFSPPRPRPFLANLPARIDSYEEGVAQFFHWRTGLDYYATIDQIVEFVINTSRAKIVDLLTDTGAFSLKLAARKGFSGRIYSFDSNITLLERAKQRAQHLNVQRSLEFHYAEPPQCPVEEGFAEAAVSIFDFHRHEPERFLAETIRILAPEGHLLLAEMLEPNSVSNRCRWLMKQLQLRYMQKNSLEARGVYYDREEMIRLLFRAGFRQVIIQELTAPASRNDGVFCLIAATK